MKIVHSLKFRFIVVFSLFIVLLCAITAIFAIRDTTDSALKVFTQAGIVIVEKAAKAIDGDAFERLAKSMDDTDPFYTTTQLALFTIKEYSSSLYLYTMIPAAGNNYTFIIDGSAPVGDKNFSPLGANEDTSSYDDAFRRSWKEKSTQYSGIHKQEEWGRLISVYAPILNSRGNMVGVVACDFEAEDLYLQIRGSEIRQTVMSLIFLAVGFGIMLFFLKMIFSRLKTINFYVREISEGEGDLTKKINLLHEDEIGELAGHFNNTLDKIKYLVVAIKDRTSSLFGIGNELTESMSETSVVVKQITGNIEDIRKQVTKQSSSVNETSTTMEQVTESIDRLNSHVAMQTASVSQSSSAIEEMLANIQSVTNTLVRNSESVTELISASEVGRKGLEEVSGDIHEIARESEGLLGINAVMENIASQTNLLSMNAAIEAAHAGEAGKGFAVVAGEIRKLAEDSTKQSRTISEVLNKIKKSIDKISNSTATVLGKFQAIDSQIRTVSDQEGNIRNAMEEQGQGSQQILEAVGKLNELTQQVKDGSGRMLEGSKGIIIEIENLNTVTRNLSGGINEMAAGTDHINETINKVNDASRVNKEHIDALVSEVSKFKVE